MQWLRNGLTCVAEAIVWALCFHATNWTQDPEDERWFTHIGIGTALLLIVTCFIPNNAYSRTARRDEVVANAMKTGLAFGILAYAIYLNIFLPLACFWFCIALAIERLILNSWFVHYALRHKEHSIIICKEDALWQQEVLLQNTYGLALTRLEQPSAQSLKEYLITHPETKSIYIEPSILSTTELEEVAHVCYEHSLTFHLLPQAVPALNRAMQSEYRGTVNVLSTTNPPLQSPFNMAIKRLTDILFSLIILLTIFPFIAFLQNFFSESYPNIKKEITFYNENFTLSDFSITDSKYKKCMEWTAKASNTSLSVHNIIMPNLHLSKMQTIRHSSLLVNS